ncbi:phage baseplate assembly protein V [Salinisphaera hydrothermalis]|uniref:phage baseplate assembly protein V n=1 Tax=Salinisphaera hydrothermalis TaxID=563188 RepID=UPI00333FB6BE
MPDIETRLADIERRQARMIQTGVIIEADYDAARVKVAVDKRESGWLPWATRRAGGDIDWWAPEVGEQVDLLCPNGELPGARVIPAFYSDQAPPPANSPDVRLIQFGNGTTIKHDRKNNALAINTPGTVDLVAGGHTTVRAPGVTVDSPLSTFTGAVTVKGLFTYEAGMSGSGGSGPTAKIDGDMKVTGDIDADGDVFAEGVSGAHHDHDDPQGGTTDEPNK